MPSDTAFVVLGLLHRGDSSGNKLAKEAEGLSDVWSTTRSHVYRELAILEKLKYVRAGKPTKPDNQRGRHATPYRVTAAGKRAYARWLKAEPGRVRIHDPAGVRKALAELVGGA